MSETLNEIRWTPLSAPYQREYSDLVDRAFSLTGSAHYLHDFPIWDPSLALGVIRHQISAWRGNRLIASASIHFTKYRGLSGDETSVGLIGAVVTHPDFQKKGLASEAIDYLLHEGLRRKVEVFALWGSESALYKRKGFRFGGKQMRIALTNLSLKKNTLSGYEIRKAYDPEVVSVLRARKIGVIYTAADRDWISNHRNVQWRTLWKEGNCLGFLAFQRGIDLTNMIHELEGNKDVIIALLTELYAEHPELELLVHPSRLPEICTENATSPGTTALEPEEHLAQFRVQPGAVFTDVDLQTLWFSGLDSC